MTYQMALELDVVEIPPSSIELGRIEAMKGSFVMELINLVADLYGSFHKEQI